VFGSEDEQGEKEQQRREEEWMNEWKVRAVIDSICRQETSFKKLIN